MKNLLFIISVIFLISCSGNSSSDETVENADSKTESETDNKETAIKGKGNCNDFLDDYEKWAKEVIEVYKKVKLNPMDMENNQKLMEATQKMSEWSENWTALYTCANNKKYSKRMEEIQKKLEKEME